MKPYILIPLTTLLLTIAVNVMAVESAYAQPPQDPATSDVEKPELTRQAIQAEFTVPLLTSEMFKSRNALFLNRPKTFLADENPGLMKWADQPETKKRKVWWIAGGAAALGVSSAILLSRSGGGSSSSATIPIPPGRP